MAASSEPVDRPDADGALDDGQNVGGQIVGGQAVGGQPVGGQVARPESSGRGGGSAGEIHGDWADGDVAATFCATLVDEWVRNGLTDAVIAPGSRSTPLALVLAAHDQVRVQVFHDERSAAFCALGLSVASRSPTLVLCTSGTASVEFHAAVVEAHRSSVPLLVVTADRPADMVERDAPQTIDQRELYGTSVRWYCEPGVPTPGGAAWWRDLARDAWHRTGGLRPGPVHVNLAFREPLLGTAGELPPARDPLAVGPVGARWGLLDEEVGRLAQAVSGRRGLIVAGGRATSGPRRGGDSQDDTTGEDAAAIFELAEALGWPILADALSGLRWPAAGMCSTFDGIVRHQGFASSHRPEVVIRIGGLLASKETNQWLARSPALQIGVDRYGQVPDPDQVLSQSFTADIAVFSDQLRSASPEPAPDEWVESWTAAETAARAAISGVLARHSAAVEPAVAVDLMAMAPEGSALVVSSSMPVRDLEWFAAPRAGVDVFANRGANGIDGVTSTAVGVSLAGPSTILLTGDVAFLHDTNALLGLTRRPADLLIVVIDNDGGGIFEFLPQRAVLSDDRFEQLFGTPHGVDVAAIALAHGIPAQRVSTRAGLQAAVAGSLTRRGARVVVVDSDRAANVGVHDELNAAVAAALDHLD